MLCHYQCIGTARGSIYFQDIENRIVKNLFLEKIQPKPSVPLKTALKLKFYHL